LAAVKFLRKMAGCGRGALLGVLGALRPPLAKTGPPPAYREREQLAEERGRRLIDLVRPQLPLEVQLTGPADAWPLVGPGLLARQVGSLEALLRLRALDRQADAFILLRSLYEHAVTFAWIAADPGAERHRRFLKSDAAARLAADDGARKVGVPLLEAEIRAKYERQLRELPKQMPDLLQRAEAADGHWSERVPGMEASNRLRSYRGLYALAYRHHSAIAHPSLQGLNFVTADLPDGSKRIQLEQRDPEMHGPFGLGPLLLAFSLYIAGQTLGWPLASAVSAAFE
jgi:hypothetical protein